MTKVGVLGIGMMGKGIVKNLLKAGYEVYAYDPLPQAAEKAQELGAEVMPGIKDVSEKVEFLLASLPTTQAVEDAVNEALLYMKPGSILCNMSTSAPTVEKVLYEAAKAKGIGYLDSPVSGGPSGAENATMSIMVGGDEEVFEKVKPVYEKIGGNVFYMGATGSGQVMKICNNIVFGTNYIILVEAFLTAVKYGLNPQKVHDIFNVSTARSATLDLLGKNLVSGSYEKIVFQCSHMHKDIDLFIDLADEFNIPTVLSSTGHQLFNSALKKGYGTQDMTAVARILEEMADQKIAQVN